MNNVFDDIGKRMPYRESGEYLDNLIDEATENAIKRQNPNRSAWHRWAMAASAAAVAILIALYNGRTIQAVTMDNQGPIDEFLSSLSDEEAAQLPFYEVEEIPEYD